MALSKNGPNLFVSFLGAYRMSQVIEHIDRVRYQDPVANRYRRPRPYSRAFTDVAPGSDLDFSAMSKSRKLTPDYAVGTNPDAIAIAPYVPNSRCSQQTHAGAKTAGGPPKEPLQVIIKIHL